MNDQEYLEHCRELLQRFARELAQRTEFLEESDPLRVLASGFQGLTEGVEDLYIEGPLLVARLFTHFPDYAPGFPRDLLWFFGGECLHYMPDEEIAQFQELEQLRHASGARSETLDLREARAKLLKLQ
jgi:hypothetical protein